MSEPRKEPREDELFQAARDGDTQALKMLLDRHPEKRDLRQAPYEWSLLHVAAHQGRLEAVELLLARGLSPNDREQGDHTYPLHWAAAAGHLEVARRLIEAGGDVVGEGD